jgi:hypothetical protein
MPILWRSEGSGSATGSRRDDVLVTGEVAVASEHMDGAH